MVQERSEFKPSLIGRVLDLALINLPASADILIGLVKANGPYKKVLEGKVTDPEKVQRATENFNLWYGRLRDFSHKNDQSPGV